MSGRQPGSERGTRTVKAVVPLRMNGVTRSIGVLPAGQPPLRKQAQLATKHVKEDDARQARQSVRGERV